METCMNSTTADKKMINGQAQRFVWWYSEEPSRIKAMKKLAEENPDEVEIVLHKEEHNKDTGKLEYESMEITYPHSWLKDPRPPIKRNYTEEQKAAMVARMKSLNGHRDSADTEEE